MLFGATAFAESTFAGLGFTPNAFVNVQGNQLNFNIGTLAFRGDANFDVTGSRTNLTLGTVTAKAGAGVSPTTNLLNFNTGSVVLSDANFSVTGNRTSSFGTVDPPDQTIGLSGKQINKAQAK